MIKVYYGDFDIIDLELSLLKKSSSRIITCIDESFKDVTNKYYSKNIFNQSTPFDVLCLCYTSRPEHSDLISHFQKDKREIKIFLYCDTKSLKNTSLYKKIGQKNFIECISLYDKYGHADKKLIRKYKDIILNLYCYKNVFDSDLIEWMLYNCKVGGLLRDLDSIIMLATQFGETNLEDLTDLTVVNDFNSLALCRDYLTHDDLENLYKSIMDENIDIMSMYKYFTGVFLDYSTVFEAFKEEGYVINYYQIKDRTGINNYYISYGKDYLERVGVKGVNYCYRYLSAIMVKNFIDNYLVHFVDDRLKRLDLLNVLRGNESFLL